MNNIDLYELIERYLLHKTSPEETAEIERRIKSDPSFASEVQLNRDMQQLITDHSLLNIKQDLKRIRTEKISKIKSKNKFYRNLLIVSSGVIIITISSLLLLNKKDIAVRSVPETPEVSGTSDDTSLYLSEREGLKKTEPLKETKTTEISSGINNAEDTANITTEKFSNYPITASAIYNKEEPGEKAKKDEDKSLTGYQKPHTADTYIIPQEKQESFPCNITAEYLTEPSCNNKATGLIKFIESSISGGTAPYKFAINGIFSDSLVYRNLPPGSYNLAIKDAFNCIKEWKMVEIEEIICFSEFKFAPLYGEIWEIPIEKSQSGVLTITNKSGTVVYQLKFDGLSEVSWNGMSIDNHMLPMGAYPFIIKYQNGDVFRGTVTIIK
jgi:hypothetical protein